MHIVVDARHLHKWDDAGHPHTVALLHQLIQFRKEDHFTIITIQPGLIPVLTNTEELVIESIGKNYIQLRKWYSKTLPALLQKMGGDVCISINGTAAKSPIPQVVFLSSPYAAERAYAGNNFFFLYKRLVKKRLAKATAVVTFTQLQQHFIAKHLHIQPEIITPVGYAVPAIYNPISWQQQEAILLEHTKGSEYFLYTGSFTPEIFLLVLKAFSFFKKRQLSNMQLVAAGHFVADNDLLEKLSTYKYRADVKLYQHVNEQTIATLTSAAYAVIWLDEKAPTAFPAMAAVRCQIPVICLEKNTATQSIAIAALYADATPESLAEQMKRVYKDENLRSQLIANAASLLPLVDGTIAAQNFWDCLLMATNENRLHLPPPEKGE